jgi:dTDP-4-dehydrorhamnose 3,5-epimerase
MQIEPTALPGVVVVSVAAHVDQRGLFARAYDADTFATAGLPTDWPQCNISWNRSRGTLRGMHLQCPPFEEPTLVRCTSGSIFDVAIDLRPESPTFRHWVGVELSAERRNALFVPGGCAHGFLTLTDNCEIFYMMGETYHSEAAAGVRWNDPAFGVVWPFAPVTMAERDANWPDFAG